MTHTDRQGSPGRAEFLERHYTLAELATAWHMSRATLVQWFRDEPGVIRYGTGKLKKGRQRIHVSLRVPESVARRVYKTRTGREI
jgi:AraC-like DNA-binding protein